MDQLHKWWIGLQRRWWVFFHERCLVGFPWFWPARPPGLPAMVVARRLVRRRLGGDHNPLVRALAQFFTAIVWPPAALLHLLMIRRFRGPEAVPIKRFPGAVWAAIRHNVLPGEYFAYALWHAQRKEDIDNYLYAKEGPRLFRIINRPVEPNPIDDKLTFYGVCKAKGIPSPEVLAVFAPAGKSLEFKSLQHVKCDLFVKQRRGHGGAGAERLRWRESLFESSRGVEVRSRDLYEYLTERAQIEDVSLIVQPNLCNHPLLRTGAGEGLATARLITGITVDEKVLPIVGFLYFPEDNDIPAKTFRAVQIDIPSGSLKQPLGFEVPKKQSEYCMLPDWQDALRYIDEAHRECSEFCFLGWDVAFTPTGPMLLEGNANWCADEYQRLEGKPLGRTNFSAILGSRLQA